MYTNETTLIGFIRPPRSAKPYLIEFDGKEIASLETVIVTGQSRSLHVPIYLTGEAIDEARQWFDIRPEGFHARVEGTLVMYSEEVYVVVNYIKAREDRSWQRFE